MQIKSRSYPAAAAIGLVGEGVSPILARVLAGRGITRMDQLSGDLAQLHHHSQLKSAGEAANYLADCIAARRPLLVVADYDCDGATACAVALRALRAFGATVDFLVPDRMIHGYGLTPSVVDLAMANERQPEVLITVDNGIASHLGIERAIAHGLEVLVTDHHLPSKIKPLPAARVIVNPSQPGCLFPSKALAGCGVIWYVMWALQDELRHRGMAIATGFKVSSLLPLVAVGTVADVVSLDRNNRVLVQAGLDRIRAAPSVAGIEALATAGAFTRCDPRKLVTMDIAFGTGPRINAAGRLKSMAIGIECLTTDDPGTARDLANQLDSINQERRQIEFDAVVGAFEQASVQVEDDTWTIAVHDPSWHAGVIGIVAGRIKEQRYRPTFVMTTDAATGEIKGSGRSIPGFNLKDALDQVDKACPGLLLKFGGHAMAAGVTMRPDSFLEFQAAFEAEARLVLSINLLNQQLETDGSLAGVDLTPATAKLLRQPVWGQGFLEPVFCDYFDVKKAKISGEHLDQLSMTLEREGTVIQATRYRHAGPAPAGRVRIAYKLSLGYNKFGQDTVKLLIDHIDH